MKSSLFCIFAVLCYSVVHGSLDVWPQNDAVLAGSTITITCSTSSLSTARIMWTEFATSGGGSLCSDNKAIVPSHPNAARYSITGQAHEFHLQIINVTMADGGLYLCQDINAGPPNVYQRYAQIVVLESHPVCDTYLPANGVVIRDVSYAGECQINYRGNLNPIMVWTGVGEFVTNGSYPQGTVWSYVRFTATRDMEGGVFQCRTYFLSVPNTPNYATNVPDYDNYNTGPGLVVSWGPENMAITPLQDSYVTGDVLTCTADAKPIPTYRWYNLRTLEDAILSQTFTVTQDLEGYMQTMRCNAVSIIEGSLFSADVFHDVNVPAVTTPTTPSTTPVPTSPPADGPCDDLTGRWASSNPDATICFEVDYKGNMLTLLRNGTDQYFVPGTGKTVFGDYRHVGFSGLWPTGLGAAGFSGECHKCYGTEVILMSGLFRNKAVAPGCGQTDGTKLTRLYVLTRSGPPCRGMELEVVNASPEHLKKMGVRAKKPAISI